MAANDTGRMVEQWWGELSRKFQGAATDAFTLMPNHIHGIIIMDVVGADLRVRPEEDKNIEEGARTGKQGARTGKQGGHAGPPLPRIVQWFKTMTTNDFIRGIKPLGWASPVGKLWQRGYYEHVIRNDESLNRIRQYIATNPLRWELDRENPQRRGRDDFDYWLTTFTVRPNGAKTDENPLRHRQSDQSSGRA